MPSAVVNITLSDVELRFRKEEACGQECYVCGEPAWLFDVWRCFVSFKVNGKPFKPVKGECVCVCQSCADGRIDECGRLANA